MANEIIKASMAEELATEGAYCSIQGGDRKSLSKIYNAMNNPEHRVGDYINKVIKVRDVFCEVIELTADDGSIEQAPRVVLIDDEGNAYQAVSAGIFNAVKNACKVFGQPTWEPALPCKIKQVNVKNGSMLTFDIA